MTCLNIARDDLTANFTKDFEYFRFQVLVRNITWNACNFQTLPFWILGIRAACLSISITFLLRSVLTFLTILISDWSLTKFSLNLRISSRVSLFTLVYCSTLFWSDNKFSAIVESLVADQSYSRLKSWFDLLALIHAQSLMILNTIL